MRRMTVVTMAALVLALASGANAETAELKFGVCSDLHLGPWNRGEYFERAGHVEVILYHFMRKLSVKNRSLFRLHNFRDKSSPFMWIRSRCG